VSKIIVNLSGWFEADPDRTMFQYIGLRYDVEKLISGQQWLELPENHRGDYALENIATAYKYSLDGDYDHIGIEVEE
jgi:hypothetical protein